jgi:hypothetical protein
VADLPRTSRADHRSHRHLLIRDTFFVADGYADASEIVELPGAAGTGTAAQATDRSGTSRTTAAGLVRASELEHGHAGQHALRHRQPKGTSDVFWSGSGNDQLWRAY